MADVAKKSLSRKALKEKNSLAAEPTLPAKPHVLVTDGERLLSPAKKGKAGKKRQEAAAASSFEKELEEMQERLQQLRIEKEKAEELVKEKDEMLKVKDEEIENRGKEHEKLQVELKKLQKLKEFKPTMNFPIFQLMKEKEQQDKKACPGKKRPSPPYILWCKDQWNKIKLENPEAEFKEISNILGGKWKSASAEEKKPFEEKYQAEKEGYLKVMAKEKREVEAMKLLEDEHKQKTAMELLDQYLQFKEEAKKEEAKKAKKEKDPLKPKQPISSFFLFTNERRAVLLAEGKKSIIEVTKITGEEWKNMSEKDKAPYEEVAKKNREKYMQEMEIYKQTKQDEALNLKKEEEELMKFQKQEALQLLKKKEKTDNIIKKTKADQQKKKKIVDPNKPKKPASSYLLFSKEARRIILEELPAGTASGNTVNAMISVKWKELGEEERKMWNEKAGEAMEAYKKELEAYNKTMIGAAQ